MTEFEIASLAFQEMAAWAAVVTAVVVGPLQCLLIWRGLRLMERGNGERAGAMERQHEADDRRHAEVMAALERQREADDRRHAEAMAESERRHAEAMAESERRHAEAMAALAVQSRAMETLIERTAPVAAAG